MDYCQCRICLRSMHIGHLTGLFDPTFSTTLERFEDLIGTKIQRNVHLPNQICALCTREITSVFTSVDKWTKIQKNIYTYQLTNTIPTFMPVIYSNSQNSFGPPNAIVEPRFSNSEQLQENFLHMNYAMSMHSKDVNDEETLSNEDACLEANLPREFSSPLFNENCLGFDLEQTSDAFLTEVLGLSNKDSVNAASSSKHVALVDDSSHPKYDITSANESATATDNLSDENINLAETGNWNFSLQGANTKSANDTNATAAKEDNEVNANYNDALKKECEISFNNAYGNLVTSIDAPFGKIANEPWRSINEVNKAELPNADGNDSNEKWINNIEVNKVKIEPRQTTEVSNDISTVLSVKTTPNGNETVMEKSVTETILKNLLTNEDENDQDTRSEHSYTKPYEENAFETYIFTDNEHYNKDENEDNHFNKENDFSVSRKSDNKVCINLPFDRKIFQSNHFIKNLNKTNHKTCGKITKSKAINKIFTKNTCLTNTVNSDELFKETSLLKEEKKIKKGNELFIGNSQPDSSSSRFNTMTGPPPLVPCRQTKSNSTKDQKCSADKPIKPENILKGIGSFANLGHKNTISPQTSFLEKKIDNKDLTNIPKKKQDGGEIYLKINITPTILSDERSEQLIKKCIKPFDNDKNGMNKCTMKDKVLTGLQFGKSSSSEQSQTKQEEDTPQVNSPIIGNNDMDVDVDDRESDNLMSTELVNEKPNIASLGKSKKTANTKNKMPLQKNKPSSTNFLMHQCCYCPREFPSQRSRSVHERIHKKTVFCYICGSNHQKGFICY